MKIHTLILAALMMMSATFTAFAIKAVPHPITVKQPDGTTITIQIHGDEFLHWTTAGNKLVEKGHDGFYYYASFNSDGSIAITNTRVRETPFSQTGTATIQPPKAAVQAANMRRQAAAQRAAAVQTSSEDMAFGDKHFLVLLIEFSDLQFTVPDARTAFTRLLNEEGYSDNGGTGSSADYYKDNSMGQFNPTFDVYGPIQVSGSYVDYGGAHLGSTERADYLLVEACQIADSENIVDFSEYDIDNDGTVDNVFFFFAGHNEAEGAGADYIWPHKWVVYRPVYEPFDGKRLNTYACASEYSGTNSSRVMAGIGTFTHEFGHVLGLPDFYDTDYEANGYANGIGAISLMDQGSYNNNGRTPPYLSGYERYMLGWLPELTEWTESGEKTLEPVQTNVAYMTTTDTDGETYVYEYRNGEGYDAYINATGIAIYHVDRSSNTVGGYPAYLLWEYSMINNVASHQLYDLVESTYPESSAIYNTDKLFPGRMNVTEFTSATTPAAVSWNGNPTGYNLYDISDNGDNATLNLIMGNGGVPIDEFVDLGINAIYLEKSNFTNGETLPLMISNSNKVPASVVWYMDDEYQSEPRVVLTTGEHTIKAELTYEDGTSEIITTKINVM